jgi:predicted dehydrogenase
MKIRIGFIGIGGLGYLQAKAYDRIEDVTIVGAADVADDARELFENAFDAPAYGNYRELLHNHSEELDAVTIVTPHALHYEQTKACIEEGLHVLIEKPMVTKVSHAVDLFESARERDVVLLVGYQRHFHPAFKEIRRVIGSGRIGELHMVNCYLGQDWVDNHRGTWRMDPTLSGGGQLYDSGSHLLDALLWTTDSTAVEVGAHIAFEEPRVDVNSALSIELDRGGDTVLASVGVSGNGVHNQPAEGYFFWGTEGRITYTDGELSVAEKDGMTYRTEITGGADFQTLNEQKLDNFVAAIEGREEPAVPGEVGLQVTAVTEAAYEAAETGTVVSVPSLIEEA